MAIPEKIKKAAQDIRGAIYGREITETLASGLETTADIADEAKKTSAESYARSIDTQNRFDDQIAGTTNSDEVIDARRPGGGTPYRTLRERLDIENQEVVTRLTQNETQKTSVNSDYFGAKGDGQTDDTVSVKELLDYARRNKKTPFLSPGTYKISGSDPLDLSDLDLDGMNAVLDFTEFTGKVAAISSGTRTLIKENAAINRASNVIEGVSADLNQGDVLIVTSEERIANTARNYYKQGEVHFVQEYDEATQKVTVYPTIDFDYTAAKIEKIIPSRLKISNEITFKGLPGSPIQGLQLKDTIFQMSCTIEGFGSGGLNIASSFGSFFGEVKDTYVVGGTTNYGVSVVDCSHAFLIGARVVGGRHAVAGGGNYPSKMIIVGGYYSALFKGNHAIDAHGVVKDIIVDGAIVHGGIQVSADHNTIVNNHIYFHENSGILFANDNNSRDWGSLKTSGNFIIGMGTTQDPDLNNGIAVFNKARSVDIGNDEVTGNWGGHTGNYLAPLFINCELRRLKLNDLTLVKEIESQQASSIYLSGTPIVQIGTIAVKSHQLLVRPNNSGIEVKLSDLQIIDSTSHGLRLEGYADYKFKLIDLSNTLITKSWHAGLFIRYAEEVLLNGVNAYNNGQSLSSTGQNRAGVHVRDVDKLKVHNGNMRDNQDTATQTSGLYLIDVASVAYSNNDFRGCAVPVNLGNSKVVSRTGNVGDSVISDYIKGSDGNLYTFDGVSLVRV